MIPQLPGFRSTTGIAVAHARPPAARPAERPAAPACFDPVDRLILLDQPGIGERTISALEAAGVHSIEALLALPLAQQVQLRLPRPLALLRCLGRLAAARC